MHLLLFSPVLHISTLRSMTAYVTPGHVAAFVLGPRLPATDFQSLAEKQKTRLAINSDAEAYLTAKQQEITQRLAALQESIGKVEGSLILDEKGHLHLPPLEKAVPEDVERLKKRVYEL